MDRHALEIEYGLTAEELLTAIQRRFRLKVALEGAVAEIHLAKYLVRLLESGVIQSFHQWDTDDKYDFELRRPGDPTLYRIECKTIRNAFYKKGGTPISYKVETRKTRNSLDSSGGRTRLYDADRFDILAVSLGKQTKDWTQFLFIRTRHLVRHQEHASKLSPLQRVPIPGTADMRPWYVSLQDLLDATE